jgi:ribosomal protein S18 acetylase RimI-like enzyme
MSAHLIRQPRLVLKGTKDPVRTLHAVIARVDASRIAELEPLWLALREHHGSVTPHWGPLRPAHESWAARRGDYEAILTEGGALFLAVDEDAIAGFAICEQEQGGSRTWTWPRDFLAIVDLVVRPGRRGAGIGAALLDAVEEEARRRGVAAIDLMVAGPNEGARRFYERAGFRPDLVTYRKPLG